MSGEGAHLCLADGTVFEGVAWGAPGVAIGELVFTTGMMGYQEVLTDPSYCGQIVTMTAPQIGNTGINPEDAESVRDVPHVSGFVVRDASPGSSSWRATETLEAYLTRHGIVALSGVDTRRLTRHLRDHGAQNGAMGVLSPAELVRRAREAPPMEGLDLVGRVTPKEPYAWSESAGAWRAMGPIGAAPAGWRGAERAPSGGGAAWGAELGKIVPRATSRHIVAIDLGAKRNILRCLVDAGCRVTVVPASMKAPEILALDPDGVFVSNGPGDPAAVTYAIDTVRELVGKRPLFGICLGHQLLALALGARTYKLKFGHRGVNQPVKDLTTGRIEVTTQNHGFAVDVASLEGRARHTHVHLNDGTSEGLDVPEQGAFSVQYHPEAAAGPHDALHLFERFVRRVDAHREQSSR